MVSDLNTFAQKGVKSRAKKDSFSANFALLARFFGINATIRTEMLCLPYAGFFLYTWAKFEPIHPYPRENIQPEKSTKKRILRNFICYLDRYFLKFLAISVGNQQRTETTNPLQIETV